MNADKSIFMGRGDASDMGICPENRPLTTKAPRHEVTQSPSHSLCPWCLRVLVVSHSWMRGCATPPANPISNTRSVYPPQRETLYRTGPDEIRCERAGCLVE